MVLTSGYPLGSKKASGMPQLGGNPGIRSARSEGGVGAAVYSVKARPLRLGVVGVVTPLAEGSSDMTKGMELDPRDLGERVKRSIAQKGGEGIFCL